MPSTDSVSDAMIQFKCLVNGSIGEAERERVRDGIAQIWTAHFGSVMPAPQVSFSEIRPGLWFTGGRPSRASMVLGSVPAGTTQAVRVAVMDAVCRMFSAVTGSDYDDVMVVAADAREAG